jgi:hypothetical protein
MRSGKAMLVGAAVLIVLAGAGAVVLASSSSGDEAGGETFAAAVDSPASERQPAPAPAAPAPEPEAPEAEVVPPAEPTDPAPGDDDPGLGDGHPPPDPAPQPAPTKSGGKPRSTRFPRERRKDPARTGKSFAVPPAQVFTGSGNALIGTVDVKAPALVKWRARGRFGLEFGREAFPIIAPSHRGELVIPPFRFELVRVLAKGAWRITVTPQG